jgi:ribosomal protein S18 acetylase RimI-like enzyme
MLQVERIGTEGLAAYAGISIAYRVETTFRVDLVENGLGGMVLTEEGVADPWLKDYDAIGNATPAAWPNQFDLSPWGLFLARDGDVPVGGAAVALKTPGLACLDGREDLAVLHDLRVAPGYRSRKVGGRLFRAAAEWSSGQGCRQMVAETQSNNVPACRFYARQGCRLGAIHRYGYARYGYGSGNLVAREVMLLWYLDLAATCPRQAR